MKQKDQKRKLKQWGLTIRGKTKIFELLADLEYEKNDVLHNFVVLESKLIKLEISPEQIDRIKISVLSS